MRYIAHDALSHQFRHIAHDALSLLIRKGRAAVKGRRERERERERERDGGTSTVIANVIAARADSSR